MLKKTQKEGTLRKSEENGRSIHLSTIVNEHCENVDLLSISTNVKVNYLGTLETVQDFLVKLSNHRCMY